MHLNEVNMVNVKTLERTMQFYFCILIASLACLSGKKKLITLRSHPGTYPQLSVPISRGSIDMVDTVFEKDVQCFVSV